MIMTGFDVLITNGCDALFYEVCRIRYFMKSVGFAGFRGVSIHLL